MYIMHYIYYLSFSATIYNNILVLLYTDIILDDDAEVSLFLEKQLTSFQLGLVDDTILFVLCFT
jgi:hypothetical protein